MTDAGQMDRRGFLGLLASGALALVAGGREVPQEQADATVLVDYAIAVSARGSAAAAAEVRWCVPGGEWQVTRGQLSKEQRVLWLTKDLGIDFRSMWS